MNFLSNGPNHPIPYTFNFPAIIEEGKKDPKSLKATNFFRREYVLNDLIGKLAMVMIHNGLLSL